MSSSSSPGTDPPFMEYNHATSTTTSPQEDDPDHITNITDESSSLPKQQPAVATMTQATTTTTPRIPENDGDASDPQLAATTQNSASASQRPSLSLLPRSTSTKRKNSLVRSFLRRITVPRHVREARNKQRQQQQPFQPDTNNAWALHKLCSSPGVVSLQAIQECLEQYPQSIQTRDDQGRYPLHLLADNEEFISREPQLAKSVAIQLMHAFPLAMIAPDHNGWLPFFRILADWVTDVPQGEPQRRGTDTTTTTAPQQQQQQQQEGTTIHHISSEQYPGRSGLWQTTSQPNGGGGSSTKAGYYFPRTEFWEEVLWCFDMLSIEMELLGQRYTSPNFRSKLSKKPLGDERTILVQALAQTMPNLVRSVLLVNDDAVDSRTKVLETTVFRRLLLCPLIIDKWLVRMLKHGGVPSRRGVDFLGLISNTTIDDYTGGVGTPLPKDWQAFHESKEAVFDAVGHLRGIIASLVALDEDQLERAASTSVTWHIMSNKLSRPFVLGLVLIDLSLHLTLMLAFRNDAELKPSIELSADGMVSSSVNIYVICSHYLVRLLCELGALRTVSRSAFWSAFWNMWTLFDLFAMILTVVTTTLNRLHSSFLNGLNAFVIGLLWIKVLAFLKVVNKEMATFVLSLTQILSDIRLFMVVLFVCICMFGDMFHVAVRGKNSGEYCNDKDHESSSTEDFCSSSWESYLRVYAFLLGDFELDDVTETIGSSILFIIFTIFGIIILLNVLIAIISDSYEKSIMSSNILFGKARVMFVAQNDALEAFLRKPDRTNHGSSLHTNNNTSSQGESEISTIKTLKRIGRWTLLSIILGTTVFTQIFLIDAAVILSDAGDEDIALFIICVILGIVLFSGIWVAALAATEGLFRQSLPPGLRQVLETVDHINRAFVKRVASYLFGLEQGKILVITSEASTEQQWNGRIRYMEQTLERIVQEVRRDMKLELQQMTAQMEELKMEMHHHFATSSSETPSPLMRNDSEDDRDADADHEQDHKMW